MGDEEDEEETYRDEFEESNDNNKSVSRRLNYDEQIIPALKKKNNNTIDQEEFQQGNLPSEAENISPEYQRMAEPVITIIGEELSKKVFSKHWNLREEALKQLLNELPKGSQSKIINHTEFSNTFLAILNIISFTIIDRITQISSKAMTLLKTLMMQKPPSITSKSDLSIFVDKIMNAVLEKLGDSSVKVREQAEDTLLSMAKNSVITCYSCVISITRLHAGKGKNGPLVRHLLGRLKLLQAIIKEFKINNHDVPYNPVMEYLLDKVEHPSSDVRALVINILVEVYKIVGDKIRADFKGLSLASREMLEKEFEMRNGGSPQKNHEVKGQSMSIKMNGSPVRNEADGILMKGKSTDKTIKGKNAGKSNKFEGSPHKPNTETLPSVIGAKNSPITNNPKSEIGNKAKGRTEVLPNVNDAKAKSEKEGTKNSKPAKKELENVKSNKTEETKTPAKGKKDIETKDIKQKNETKGMIPSERNEQGTKRDESNTKEDKALEGKKTELVPKKPLNQPNQENSKRKSIKS